MSFSNSPTVTVNGCTIMGTSQPATRDYPKALDVFYGIPFATAKRFQPAVLTAPEPSRRIDASKPGTAQPCAFAPHAIAENPLRLNVFRPALRSATSSTSSPEGGDAKLLPVVVYVHGGGFNFGHALERDVGSFVSWAKRDVLAVSVSYRIGAMGFPTGEEGGASVVKEMNLGLRDQRVAVEWVREWIDRPPLTHPFPLPFKKAILESGSATARSVLSPKHPRPASQWQDLKAFAWNKALDTLPVDDLIQASVIVYADHASAVTWPFQPVVDGPGGVIPDLPLNLWNDLVLSGRAKDISIITGFCSHEGTLFAPQSASTSSEFRSFFSTLIPSLSPSDLDSLELLYPDPLIDSASPYRQLPGIGGPQRRPYGAQFRRIHEAYAHYAYICPVLHTAHVLSRAGARVYLYEFAALAAPFRAASHGDQAPIVAHDMTTLRSAPGLTAIAKEMNTRWTSFVASPQAISARQTTKNGLPSKVPLQTMDPPSRVQAQAQTQ
ncbi:Acetylcholinesterase-like protein [Cladobotryum mycophilum]|uniref:Acetylcholinesterase-like protein n=1 Tax=Cladobotryum mycophilum TaxID=491253 RepID=A0ABR0T061_9HYPO